MSVKYTAQTHTRAHMRTCTQSHIQRQGIRKHMAKSNTAECGNIK